MAPSFWSRGFSFTILAMMSNSNAANSYIMAMMQQNRRPYTLQVSIGAAGLYSLTAVYWLCIGKDWLHDGNGKQPARPAKTSRQPGRRQQGEATRQPRDSHETAKINEMTQTFEGVRLWGSNVHTATHWYFPKRCLTSCYGLYNWYQEHINGYKKESISNI